MAGAAETAGEGMLRPGFAFPETSFEVSAELQAEKLACCGVDPAVHGDRADPTMLGLAALDAMRASGLSMLGQVHVAQRFRVMRPLLVDATVLARGSVTGTGRTDRGTTFSAVFDYLDESGEVVVSATRTSLRPDPAGSGKSGPRQGPRSESRAERNAGGGSAGGDGGEFSTVLSRTLEPEKVARYSGAAGNLIHSDPETARKHGFRAPIAAGLMGVHLFTEALARGGYATYDIDIRFRRPMFWDDTLTLEAREEAGRFAEMRLLTSEGKTAVAAVLREAVRQEG